MCGRVDEYQSIHTFKVASLLMFPIHEIIFNSLYEIYAYDLFIYPSNTRPFTGPASAGSHGAI